MNKRDLIRQLNQLRKKEIDQAQELEEELARGECGLCAFDYICGCLAAAETYKKIIKLTIKKKHSVEDIEEKANMKLLECEELLEEYEDKYAHNVGDTNSLGMDIICTEALVDVYESVLKIIEKMEEK